MKVLHVSRSDGGGGAMRAGMRLHRAMLAEGVDSRLLVAQQQTDDPSVFAPAGRLHRAWTAVRGPLGQALTVVDRASNHATRSYNVLPTGMHELINRSDADVVNLHWVGAETISVSEIGRIRKPVVWTLRDMWPFSGSLHYDDPPGAERFAMGYDDDPWSGSGQPKFDLDRWTHRRKAAAWRRLNLHVVGLSRWVADCARRSILFRERPVVHIPNAIDLQQFKPRSREAARDVLGLPRDALIVLFGAVKAMADPRKGGRYLLPALEQAWLALPESTRARSLAVVFGSHDIGVAAGPVPIRAIGAVADEATLALLHTAADLFIVPSLQENLPNTAIEAAACQRPSIGFNVGGIPDVIVDGKTGYLTPPGDVDALGKAIYTLLADESQRQAFGVAAREHAEACFAPARVIGAYLDFYGQAIASHGN